MPAPRIRHLRPVVAVTVGALAAALSGLGGQGHADAADRRSGGASSTALLSAAGTEDGLHRYLVRFAPGQDAVGTGLRSAVEAVGGRFLGGQVAPPTAVIDLPAPMAGAVAGLPGVASLEPD